jgi:hypothetical protein
MLWHSLVRSQRKKKKWAVQAKLRNPAWFHVSLLPSVCIFGDRLCGLVVRVLDYRCRGPGFDSRALQRKKESSGSGTGCTQPREYNWGATW